MSNKKNYYEILGVDNNCDINEIKKAYKKLALKYHPDKNNGDKESELKFQEVAEAYAVLNDPNKRKMYDLTGEADDFQFNMGEDFDPFSLFNNIFKSHMDSFANMKYEKNFDLGEILGNMNGFQIPVKGVRVSVHTFPSEDMFDNNMFIKQENLQDILNRENIDEENIPNLGNLLSSFSNELLKTPLSPFELFGSVRKSNSAKKTMKTDSTKIKSKAPLIEKNLKITFEELYCKKFKKVKIKVTRNRNGKFIQKDKILKIPLVNKSVLFENEGNEVKGSSIGDIRINIVLEKRSDLLRIGEYNLLYFKEIELSDIYNNNNFDIRISDSLIIKVKSMPLISNQYLSNLQVIKNKGIQYPEGGGDLYIFYKIALPKKLDTEKLDSKLETNERIDDDLEYRDYAINCKLEKLFI